MQKDQIEIPDYIVKRRLGSGGMASVFLAVHTPLKREVALKVMSSQLGEDSVWAKRFIQEAQVIAQLSHPNVVPVFDVGTHNNQFYISMELLKGGSLKDLMRDPIDTAKALKIVAGIAAGLDYASEKGFVHRDIKPDNIMFRDSGEPVILDFGIVKSMDLGPSKMTQTGTIIGTVTYMSPEQAQGHPLDQRSDIYSLGVVFYELLTGQQPYRGDTDVATILKHISEPIPKLPQAMAVFQPIIDRAMAKDPFDRYTRAREIIDHIQSLEPEIKQALKAIAKNKTNSTDATRMMDTSPGAEETVVRKDDTKTRVSNYTPPEEDDDDLTKVLSSAKATIRDFSADTRQRKAKRTKTTIFSAVAIALMASSYLGYHQLVVVPQERAVAEAKLREKEEKLERKIDALFAEARTLKKDFRPSDVEQADGLIAIYRQVLKLDPENQKANIQLTQLGERYISLAQIAAKRSDLSKASTYREYAEALVPDSPELASLRSEIKAIRSQKLESQLVNEEIETLLSVASAEIKSTSGFSDLANTKIQQVLRISEDHPKAKHLLQTMQENLYSETEQALNSGNLSLAKSNLALMEVHYPNPDATAKLSAKLKSLSSSAQQKKALKSMLTEATQLERERRTIAVNDKLRELYRNVLSLAPKNSTALTGLRETSQFESKQAYKAITDRDYKQAQKHIDAIAAADSGYANLGKLKDALKTAMANGEQAEKLLLTAKSHIAQASASKEQHQAQYTALDQATNTLAQVKKLDPSNPQLTKSYAALEEAYVLAITNVISDNNIDLAETYFADISDVNWPSNRLLDLQTEYTEKKAGKKKKHIITTGF